MKKLNFINKKIFRRLSIFLVSIALLSCKSMPEDPTLTIVDPIDLLDNNSTFYISVPKNVDPELINKIIKSNMNGASDSDVNQICSRINKVYAGLNKMRKTTEFQASIDSDIPVQFVPSILTKKNGWSSTKVNPENGTGTYSIYSYDDLDITFPSSKIACLGRNLNEMLQYYDEVHYIPAEDSIGKKYNQIDENVYNWLKSSDDEITFYATNPASYLTILMGASLDLKLSDVKGKFKVNPDYKDEYLLDLTFNFKSNTALKAGRILLSLAFGLTNSDTETPTNTELVVKNIHISKDQLYKLFIQAN